jgi:hypothetical protein
MMMEHGIDVAPHDSDVLPNAGVHVSPRPRDILLQLLGEVQLAEAPNENDSPQMLDHEDACETEYHHHHTEAASPDKSQTRSSSRTSQ